MATENSSKEYKPRDIAFARLKMDRRCRPNGEPLILCTVLSSAARLILAEIALGLSNRFPEAPITHLSLTSLGKVASVGKKQAGYIIESLEHPTTFQAWGGDLIVPPNARGEHCWASYVRTVYRHKRNLEIYLHPAYYRGGLNDFLDLTQLPVWPDDGPWPSEARTREKRGKGGNSRSGSNRKSESENEQTLPDLFRALGEVVGEVLGEVEPFTQESLTSPLGAAVGEVLREETSVNQESTSSLSPPSYALTSSTGLESMGQHDLSNVLEINTERTTVSKNQTQPFDPAFSRAPAHCGEAALGEAHPLPAKGGACALQAANTKTEHKSILDTTRADEDTDSSGSMISGKRPVDTNIANSLSREPLEGMEQTHYCKNKDSVVQMSMSEGAISDIHILMNALRDHGQVTLIQPVFADRIVRTDGETEDRALRWPGKNGADEKYSRHIKLEEFSVNGHIVKKNTVPTWCSPDDFLKNELEKVSEILDRKKQIFKKRGNKEKVTNSLSLGTHVYVMGIQGSHSDKTSMKYFVLDDVIPNRFYKLFSNEGYFKHIFIQTSVNKFQMLIFTDSWLTVEKRRELQSFFASLNVPENEPPFADPGATSGERFFRLPGARNRKPGRENFEARIYGSRLSADVPYFEYNPVYLNTIKYYIEGEKLNESLKTDGPIDEKEIPTISRTQSIRMVNPSSSNNIGQDKTPSAQIFRQACRAVRQLCNKTAFKATAAEMYLVASDAISKSSMIINGTERAPKTVAHESKKIVETLVPQWRSQWISSASSSTYHGKTINEYIREKRLL